MSLINTINLINNIRNKENELVRYGLPKYYGNFDINKFEIFLLSIYDKMKSRQDKRELNEVITWAKNGNISDYSSLDETKDYYSEIAKGKEVMIDTFNKDHEQTIKRMEILKKKIDSRYIEAQKELETLIDKLVKDTESSRKEYNELIKQGNYLKNISDKWHDSRNVKEHKDFLDMDSKIVDAPYRTYKKINDKYLKDQLLKGEEL